MRRFLFVGGLFVAIGVAFGNVAVSRADDEVEVTALASSLDSAPGFDISWPQCGKAYPPGPVAFAVVGINNGKPFTANPCFLHQFEWAKRIETTPAVYLNTAFPKPGVPEALAGPYGACAETDGWCRGYNYGWGLAKDVVERARAMRVSPSMYWLDVETGNYWSSDTQNNSQVIRAALDYFRAQRLPAGIYGTPYQWRLIAGNWQSPGIAIWTAGAQGVAMAASRCNAGYAFAGGTVVMVQYYDWGFDTNHICPGTETLFKHPEPHPIISGPRGRTSSHLGAQLRYWQALPMLSN